jgi:hypothetical protein
MKEASNSRIGKDLLWTVFLKLRHRRKCSSDKVGNKVRIVEPMAGKSVQKDITKFLDFVPVDFD